MPRGRRSLQDTSARASPSPAPIKGSDSSARRLTRSSGKQPTQPNVTENVLNKASHAFDSPAVKRPRGRPSRASTVVKATSSISQLPSPAATVPSSAASRRTKTAVAAQDSTSSTAASNDGSTDFDMSTPATSMVPTPAAMEDMGSAKSAVHSFEVRLRARSGPAVADPERALRKSLYSLGTTSARRTNAVVMDSEDEDLSDNSLGAQTARRLQEAEFAKIAPAAKLNAISGRRSGRNLASSIPSPASIPVGPSQKRARSSAGSLIKQAPPAKKSKVVADSKDSELSGIDMDAEAAAAMVLDSEDDISDPLPSDDSLSFADGSDVDQEDDASASSESEDELLNASDRRRMTAMARASALRHQATRRPRVRPSLISSVVQDSEASELASLPGMEALSDMSSVTAVSSGLSSVSTSDSESAPLSRAPRRITEQRRAYRANGNSARVKRERDRLEWHHPELKTMWSDLKSMPILDAGTAEQPQTISRRLKPFQLQGLAWMKEMEKTEWRGGLLGDEMGLGKTIQAVSLIMSDYPAKQPSLVLVPPVALMQWQSEIKSYTDGTLKTFVFHGTNQKIKGITVKELKKYDVLMMSYNSLESMYRKQERGFKRKDGIHKEQSVIHSINFHRIILDEAHCIKTRTTMTAKACFALKTDYRWCLTGTPLQNRIGELFSLIRFLNIKPFASYLCKQCSCSSLEWNMNDDNRCRCCHHAGMQHVSVFNQELLNPIQKFGNLGPGNQAFRKLRQLTERIMLRRLKKDHTDSMELPVKEIYVDRQFFGEEENDFANSIMTNGQRKFDTYVAQGVLLNNYANIFGLIMQMRQVADHPDLLLKKHAEGGQNVLVCCICDEPAEDTVRSRCKHDFCRACVSSYIRSTDEPDCPRCHISLSIDLEQPEIEQDESLVKKSSIINRIKMENWTSSSKIELLVHELHKLRSNNASHKSIIFSQFTTMLQLIEWRLRRAGITTVMLDGSMTPAQRQASIEHFMNKVDVECFLVSLKAGGVALNLTEASRVFIVDPWWNPAAEWQSADRCHRIGQTRPCTITRLCIEDSVESRMVLIQEKKTSMIHSTVNGDDKAMESLTPEDMQFLFRGS